MACLRLAAVDSPYEARKFTFTSSRCRSIVTQGGYSWAFTANPLLIMVTTKSATSAKKTVGEVFATSLCPISDSLASFSSHSKGYRQERFHEIGVEEDHPVHRLNYREFHTLL